MSDIGNAIENIKTKEDFLLFMEMLTNDSIANIQKWENQTIPDYLEAMGRWTETIEWYYKNNGITDVDLGAVNWRVLADILLAAKYYE